MAQKSFLPFFAELLGAHLVNGTRPDGTSGVPGESWRLEYFAAKAALSYSLLRKILSAERCPKYVQGIEKALFGDNSDERYTDDIRRLRAAHQASRRPGSEPFYKLIDPCGADVALAVQSARPPATAHGAARRRLTAHEAARRRFSVSSPIKPVVDERQVFISHSSADWKLVKRVLKEQSALRLSS
jgi:hypothetical protein